MRVFWQRYALKIEAWARPRISSDFGEESPLTERDNNKTNIAEEQRFCNKIRGEDMKHYETPQLKIVIHDMALCTVIEASGQQDGLDTNAKFNDIWNRG